MIPGSCLLDDFIIDELCLSPACITIYVLSLLELVFMCYICQCAICSSSGSVFIDEKSILNEYIWLSTDNNFNNTGKVCRFWLLWQNGNIIYSAIRVLPEIIGKFMLEKSNQKQFALISVLNIVMIPNEFLLRWFNMTLLKKIHIKNYYRAFS